MDVLTRILTRLDVEFERGPRSWRRLLIPPFRYRIASLKDGGKVLRDALVEARVKAERVILVALNFQGSEPSFRFTGSLEFISNYADQFR